MDITSFYQSTAPQEAKHFSPTRTRLSPRLYCWQKNKSEKFKQDLREHFAFRYII